MKNMKRQYLYLIVLFLTMYKGFTQNKLYDEQKVTKKIELNLALSNFRGIEDKETIYFIENDNQTLSAYKNGKLKWKTNIIKVCGKPKVGEPKVRYIKLNEKVIQVIFGKHSMAEVDMQSGKTKFIGND
jgi:hypothetical protein